MIASDVICHSFNIEDPQTQVLIAQVLNRHDTYKVIGKKPFFLFSLFSSKLNVTIEMKEDILEISKKLDDIEKILPKNEDYRIIKGLVDNVKINSSTKKDLIPILFKIYNHCSPVIDQNIRDNVPICALNVIARIDKALAIVQKGNTPSLQNTSLDLTGGKHIGKKFDPTLIPLLEEDQQCISCGHHYINQDISNEEAEIRRQAALTAKAQKELEIRSMGTASGNKVRKPRLVQPAIYNLCFCLSIHCGNQPDGGSCAACQTEAYGQIQDPKRPGLMVCSCQICRCSCVARYKQGEKSKIMVQLAAAATTTKKRSYDDFVIDLEGVLSEEGKNSISDDSLLTQPMSSVDMQRGIQVLPKPSDSLSSGGTTRTLLRSRSSALYPLTPSPVAPALPSCPSSSSGLSYTSLNSSGSDFGYSCDPILSHVPTPNLPPARVIAIARRCIKISTNASEEDEVRTQAKRVALGLQAKDPEITSHLDLYLSLVEEEAEENDEEATRFLLQKY